jgi:hypothetical protein
LVGKTLKRKVMAMPRKIKYAVTHFPDDIEKEWDCLHYFSKTAEEGRLKAKEDILKRGWEEEDCECSVVESGVFTIRQLMEELSKYNPNAEVLVLGDDDQNKGKLFISDIQRVHAVGVGEYRGVYIQLNDGYIYNRNDFLKNRIKRGIGRIRAKIEYNFLKWGRRIKLAKRALFFR